MEYLQNYVLGQIQHSVKFGVFLFSVFWAWLCTLKVCSARKNALLELMVIGYYVYPQTAEETVYKIVFGVNYLSTQKFRFENALDRGATRGGRGEPSLSFLENLEKILKKNLLVSICRLNLHSKCSFKCI